MYRKALIALAAVTALAVAVPLDASVARGSHGGGHGGGGHGGGGRGGGYHGGGGWHGGGGFRGASIGRGFSGSRGFHSFRGMGVQRAWRGGGWRGGRFGHRRHGRFFFAAAPLLYAAPYGYSDYYYDDCYQLQPVPTRWGLSWQRVWVCY